MKGKVAATSGRAPQRGPKRHGRPARAALLPAGQQCRALRRRHRQHGGARPSRRPDLLRRPRRPPRHRGVPVQGRAADRRRAGLADRIFARWRGRPTTIRNRPRRSSPSSTCPYIAAHPAEFQTLEQWGASDRGLMPVETTIMVAIPRTRRRHRADGFRRPLRFVRRHLHRLRARLLLPDGRRPRDARLRRARRDAGPPASPNSWRCAVPSAPSARSAW